MVHVCSLSVGKAMKRSSWKATGPAGNEGEKGEGESNVAEKTKAFSAAHVSSSKFRGSGFSSCSGPASRPPSPAVRDDAR